MVKHVLVSSGEKDWWLEQYVIDILKSYTNIEWDSIWNWYIGLKWLADISTASFSKYVYKSDNPYNWVGNKKKVLEIIKEFTAIMDSNWLLPTFFNYLMNFTEDIDISNIDKIKLNSQWFENLSIDSKRRIVLYKLIKKLETIFEKKITIFEYSSSRLNNEWKSLEQFKNESIWRKKRENFYFIDIDNKDKNYIDKEKSNFKINWLNTKIKEILSFLAKYKKDISSNKSLEIELSMGMYINSLSRKIFELFAWDNEWDKKEIDNFNSSIWYKDRAIFDLMRDVAWKTFDIQSNSSLNPGIEPIIDESKELNFWTKKFNISISWFLPFSYKFTENTFNWMNAFLSYREAKELYSDKFLNMWKSLVDLFWWTIPSEAWLVDFWLSVLQTQSSRNSLYNWEIDKEWEQAFFSRISFDFNNLSETEKNMLVTFLSKELFSLDFNERNLSLSLPSLSLDTKEDGEDISISWFFQENKWLEYSNLLFLKWNTSSKNKLIINISDFDIDRYIFTIVQISYFLKYKKFLNSKMLYANIYHLYNLSYIEWSEIFDISIFENQYEEFIKSVIAWSSIEYWSRFKPSHTILLWTQWTWKSQFILNLIKNKKFTHKWTDFNLNAIVFPIDLIWLDSMIKWWDSSYIKNRIREVQKNTWLPIIVVIEDICTLIEENEDTWDSNLLSQSLTTLFEWMWSLNNLTVISTTNYPEKLPPRLTRKWRFETLIPFMPLSDIKEIKWIFDFHIDRINIRKYLPKNFLEMYSSKFIWTTPSHIADFLSKINREIEFIKVINNSSSYKISEKDICWIFEKLNFSINTIEDRRKQMEEWLSNLRDKNWKWKIWF